MEFAGVFLFENENLMTYLSVLVRCEYNIKGSFLISGQSRTFQSLNGLYFLLETNKLPILGGFFKPMLVVRMTICQE
jgi:hypothetical protein